MRNYESLEKKVKGCYSNKPFPNLLSKANDFNSELERNVRFYHFIIKYLYEGHILKAPKNALVAGCGTGEDLISIANIFKPGRLLGIDITPASLKIARKNLFRANLGKVKLARMSILKEFPLYKGSYNLIFCSGVLHHLDDPYLGFKYLAEKLAPKGNMVISLYNPYGYWRTRFKNWFLDRITFTQEKRIKWALRLKFHDGKDRAQLFDAYVHPQVKYFSIGDVKAWSEECGLVLTGLCPPLDLRGLIEFGIEGSGYAIQNVRLVRALVSVAKMLFPSKREEQGQRQQDISLLKVIVFQFIFAVIGKGECYYLLENR